MLTNILTKTLPIPGEPGETVTIRRLSFAGLKAAEGVQRDEALKIVASLGDLADRLPSSAGAPAVAAASEPANKYDRLTVLQHGVTAWTYNVPVADNLAELDEQTAAWLFDEIIGFSLRSADEGEASGSVSPPTTA